MTLPARNEARRRGLEVLSLYFYDGPEAAARAMAEIHDHDMVYAMALYYLKSLSEYVKVTAMDNELEVAEVLQLMGRRILATDDEPDDG